MTSPTSAALSLILFAALCAAATSHSYVNQGEIKQFDVPTQPGELYNVRLSGMNGDADLFVLPSGEDAGADVYSLPYSSVKGGNTDEAVAVVATQASTTVLVSGFDTANFTLSTDTAAEQQLGAAPLQWRQRIPSSRQQPLLASAAVSDAGTYVLQLQSASEHVSVQVSVDGVASPALSANGSLPLVISSPSAAVALSVSYSGEGTAWFSVQLTLSIAELPVNGSSSVVLSAADTRLFHAQVDSTFSYLARLSCGANDSTAQLFTTTEPFVAQQRPLSAWVASNAEWDENDGAIALEVVPNMLRSSVWLAVRAPAAQDARCTLQLSRNQLTWLPTGAPGHVLSRARAGDVVLFAAPLRDAGDYTATLTDLTGNAELVVADSVANLLAGRWMQIAPASPTSDAAADLSDSHSLLAYGMRAVEDTYYRLRVTYEFQPLRSSVAVEAEVAAHAQKAYRVQLQPGKAYTISLAAESDEVGLWGTLRQLASFSDYRRFAEHGDTLQIPEESSETMLYLVVRGGDEGGVFRLIALAEDESEGEAGSNSGPATTSAGESGSGGGGSGAVIGGVIAAVVVVAAVAWAVHRRCRHNRRPAATDDTAVKEGEGEGVTLVGRV